MADSTTAFVADNASAFARLMDVFRTGDEDTVITAFQVERDYAFDDRTAAETLDKLLCVAYLRALSRLLDFIEDLGIDTKTNTRCLAWAVQSGNDSFVDQQCRRGVQQMSVSGYASALDAAISTAYSLGRDKLAGQLVEQLIATYAHPDHSRDLYKPYSGAGLDDLGISQALEDSSAQGRTTALAVVWAPGTALVARAHRLSRCIKSARTELAAMQGALRELEAVAAAQSAVHAPAPLQLEAPATAPNLATTGGSSAPIARGFGLPAAGATGTPAGRGFGVPAAGAFGVPAAAGNSEAPAATGGFGANVNQSRPGFGAPFAHWTAGSGIALTGARAPVSVPVSVPAVGAGAGPDAGAPPAARTAFLPSWSSAGRGSGLGIFGAPAGAAPSRGFTLPQVGPASPAPALIQAASAAGPVNPAPVMGTANADTPPQPSARAFSVSIARPASTSSEPLPYVNVAFKQRSLAAIATARAAGEATAASSAPGSFPAAGTLAPAQPPAPFTFDLTAAVSRPLVFPSQVRLPGSGTTAACSGGFRAPAAAAAPTGFGAVGAAAAGAATTARAAPFGAFAPPRSTPGEPGQPTAAVQAKSQIDHLRECIQRTELALASPAVVAFAASTSSSVNEDGSIEADAAGIDRSLLTAAERDMGGAADLTSSPVVTTLMLPGSVERRRADFNGRPMWIEGSERFKSKIIPSSALADLPPAFADSPFRPRARPADVFPNSAALPPLEECVVIRLPVRIVLGSAQAVTRLLNRRIVSITRNGMQALGEAAIRTDRSELVRALLNDFGLPPTIPLLRAALRSASLESAKAIVDFVSRCSAAGEVLDFGVSKPDFLPPGLSTSELIAVKRAAGMNLIEAKEVAPAPAAGPGSKWGSGIFGKPKPSNEPVVFPAPITAGNWAERLFVASTVVSALHQSAQFCFPGDVFAEAAGTILPSGAVVPALPAAVSTSEDDYEALAAIDPEGAIAASKQCEPVIGGGFVVSLRPFLSKCPSEDEVEAAVASLLAAAPAPSSKEELDDLVIAVESQRRRALFRRDARPNPRRTELLRWLFSFPEACAALRAYDYHIDGSNASTFRDAHVRSIAPANGTNAASEATAAAGQRATTAAAAAMSDTESFASTSAPALRPTALRVPIRGTAYTVPLESTDRKPRNESCRRVFSRGFRSGGRSAISGLGPATGKTAARSVISLMHPAYAYEDWTTWPEMRGHGGPDSDPLDLAALSCDTAGVELVWATDPARRSPDVMMTAITAAASRGQFRTLLLFAQAMIRDGSHTALTGTPLAVAPHSIRIARWLLDKGFGGLPKRLLDAPVPLDTFLANIELGRMAGTINDSEDDGDDDGRHDRPRRAVYSRAPLLAKFMQLGEVRAGEAYIRSEAPDARSRTPVAPPAALASTQGDISGSSAIVVVPVVQTAGPFVFDTPPDALALIGELAREALHAAPEVALRGWSPLGLAAIYRTHARLNGAGPQSAPLRVRPVETSRSCHARGDTLALHPFTRTHSTFSALLTPNLGVWARQCPADILSYAQCLTLHPLVSTLRILHEHGHLRPMARSIGRVRITANSSGTIRSLTEPLESWLLLPWMSKLQEYSRADRGALIDAAFLLAQLRVGVGLISKTGKTLSQVDASRVPVSDVAVSLEDIQMRVRGGMITDDDVTPRQKVRAQEFLARPGAKEAHTLASSERPWAVKVPSPGTVEYGLFDDGMWAPFSLETVLSGDVIIETRTNFEDYRDTIIRGLWPEMSSVPGTDPLHDVALALPRLRSCILLGVNPVPSELVWGHVAISGSLRAAKLLVDFANHHDTRTPPEFRYTDIDLTTSQPLLNTHTAWVRDYLGSQFSDLVADRTYRTPCKYYDHELAVLPEPDDTKEPQQLPGRRESQLLVHIASMNGIGTALRDAQLTLALWLLHEGADPVVRLRIQREYPLEVCALEAAILAARGNTRPCFNRMAALTRTEPSGSLQLLDMMMHAMRARVGCEGVEREGAGALGSDLRVWGYLHPPRRLAASV